MTASLSDLKPGDKVVLRYSLSYIHDKIVTIDRRTKTQIIVGTHRFRISDGEKIGANELGYYRIVPVTPALVAEVERLQQIKQDQIRAHDLAAQIYACVSDCTSAADIPRLEAALSTLKGQ